MFVKQCKIKETRFYILQGRIFDFIFINKIFKKKLELQIQYKLDDLDTKKFDCMYDVFQGDEISLTESIYWISQDDRFVV